MATRKGNRTSESKNQSTRRAAASDSGRSASRGASAPTETSGRQSASQSTRSGTVQSADRGRSAAGAGGTSTSVASDATSARSSAGATAPRGTASATRGAESGREPLERERDLQTAREGGASAEPGVRSSAGSPQRSYTSPVYAYGSGGSPFAMMRRMMEDMDRLFSDFGFTQPGLLASSFFGPDAWSGTERASEGGGSPARDEARRSLSSGPRQGLQRTGGAGGLPSAFWAPQVEVFDRGDNLVVRADLPGLSREDVNVEVEDDALVISGHRHNQFEDEGEGFYRSERGYGSFYRVIPLPQGVEAQACNATFRDGVLEVTLPRPAQRRPATRKVDIR